MDQLDVCQVTVAGELDAWRGGKILAPGMPDP